MNRLAFIALTASLGGGLGCSGAVPPHPPQAVAPAPPPKDDGDASQGGEGGAAHAAALENLLSARPQWRLDKQNSLRINLPDGPNWTRVKFWGIKSLVGFRYGKDHHAIVAGVTIPVDDETAPGACGKAFEKWAQPYVDSFEVNLDYDAPRALDWNGKIVDITSLVARTATLGNHDQYAVAFATYPVWPKACLVMGVAVPARDELERAKAVRDRFVAEVLPGVKVTSKTLPPESY